MNFKAKAKIDNQIVECIGTIVIHWKKAPQVYVTWSFFCSNKLIASKSENLFYNGQDETENEILMKVLKKIENYRLGRKKIFENVELCS